MYQVEIASNEINCDIFREIIGITISRGDSKLS